MRKALDPVMLELGSTLYICQLFENSLSLLHSLIDNETSAPPKVTPLSMDYSKMVLGRLLILLRKKIDVPSELDDFIDQGIKMRNEAVHSYLIRNAERLVFPDDRKMLIEEIITLWEGIRSRDLAVCALIDEYLRKYGTSTAILKHVAPDIEPDR